MCNILTTTRLSFVHNGTEYAQIAKVQATANCKEALAIRRIFSLVDMITKPKFSNCPNIFKIGLFR